MLLNNYASKNNREINFEPFSDNISALPSWIFAVRSRSGGMGGSCTPAQADGDMMYDTVGDEHLEDIVGVQSTDTKAAQCGVKDDAVCKTQTLEGAADEKHLPRRSL